MIMLDSVCFLFTSCFIFTEVLSSICEDHGVYEEDGFCYWVTETNQSVDAGVTLCDVYGGIPARVFKSRHQLFFATLHQSHYSNYNSIYIGVRDWANIGNYTGWLGFPLEDNQWGNGEPASNGKCVISSKFDSFIWKVVNCTESHYMACSCNIDTQCHLPPLFSMSLQPSPSSFSIETVTVNDFLVVDSFFPITESDCPCTESSYTSTESITVTESNCDITIIESDCGSTVTQSNLMDSFFPFIVSDCSFTESVCTSTESITITESNCNTETTFYSTVIKSDCASTITESVCGTTTTESDLYSTVTESDGNSTVTESDFSFTESVCTSTESITITESNCNTETTFYSTVTESDCASTIRESVCGTTTTESDLYSTVTESDGNSTVTESDFSFTESVCTSTESIAITESNCNTETTFYSTVTESDCASTIRESVCGTTTTESDLYSTVTESDGNSTVTESDFSFTESMCTSTESITITESNCNTETTFYSTVTESDCACTITELVFGTTTIESDLYSTVTESDCHQTLILTVTDYVNSPTPTLQITDYQSVNTQVASGVTFSDFPQTSSVDITYSLTFAALNATSTNLSLQLTSYFPLLSSSTGTSVLSKEQVDEMVEQLKDAIEIDKRQTKSFLRRYNCDRDPRISSTVVGSIGVIIIVLAATAVVVLDFPVLIQTVQTAFRILKCAGNGNRIIENNVQNNIVDNSFEDVALHV